MIYLILVMKMKNIKKTFEILSSVSISLAFILLLIEKISGWEFHTAIINRYTLETILFGCSGIFLLISIIIELAAKSEEKKTATLISRIITCAITVILAFEINSDGKERRYYEFTSPDGQHSVVAEERTYLLAGSVELYERVNPLFMERKEYYSTDDGYRPISNGDYSVAWQDNVMTITMQDGNGNYETINIYT